MTSPIQRLPASALDPDRMEQQYASQLHGSEGAYQLPFLQAAMYERRRRGQQLQDMNLLANEQAGALAQREMDVTERGQLRTLAGTGYAHGVPADPNLYMIGGMPTPQSAVGVAQAGNRQIQLESDARATQNLGSGAHAAAQAGVDPLAMPSMPQVRIEPLASRTARAGGSGGQRTRIEMDEFNNARIIDERVPENEIAGRLARSERIMQERRDSVYGNQMLQRNTRLRSTVDRVRGEIASAGGQSATGGDGNHFTVTGRIGNRTVVRTYDSQGNEVGQPRVTEQQPATPPARR
jgi:hypothetical protein